MSPTTGIFGWLNARRRAPDGQWLIGGSEAAACLGWDPWCSPLQLYYRKRGEAPAPTSSDVLEAGRRLEPVILEWYAERTGRPVVRVASSQGRLVLRDAWPPDPPDWLSLRRVLVEYEVLHPEPLTARHPSHPWMAASVDAFAFDAALGWGVIDAKNLHAGRREEWATGVPPAYTAQLTHYTIPTPFRWGGFAVLFGGQRLEHADILRGDVDQLAPGLVAAEREMVHRLERGLPPAAGADPAERDLLAALRPEPPGPAVGWVAPYDAGGTAWEPEDWDQQYQEARELHRASARERASLEAVLLGVASGAGAVSLPGGVTYRIARDAAGRLRITRRDPMPG